ncbi:MAG: protein kinase family protein [Pseudonocardiaceae bacterium]
MAEHAGEMTGPVSADSTGRGPHPLWLTPGAIVEPGRYRLLAEVGRDDRCAVRLWHGRDLLLDRDVALTLFIAAPHDPGGAELIRSAVGRALRCARLETAGAARVLDVLEPDSGDGSAVAIVVAEWTPGRALVELLGGGLPPPSVAASVLVPLAGAVDAAHNAGLVLGCDHPGRIRVTPDWQARFAFPGPPPTTGSRDDVRGLGAMLYLLLTGYWPLPGGPGGLPPAPLRPDGSPISPAALRPGVPVELSTLALRSLAGPGTSGGVHTGAAVQQVLELNASTADLDLLGAAGRRRPADPARARRRRRIKLSVSMTVLAATTLLILGYAGLQVVSVFANAGGTPLVVAGPSPATQSAPPVAPSALSASVRVKNSAVYDPSGLGSPDHQKDVGKLLDGNPNTAWSTDSYRQQFPVYKKGLGIMLSFDQPTAAALVTVISPSPGTVVEIRTAASPNASLTQTTLVGKATLGRGSTRIPLRAGPPTRYLLVWITSLGGGKDRNQSKLSEVGVQRRAT